MKKVGGSGRQLHAHSVPTEKSKKEKGRNKE
jgi:hypothetical protein